jgi:hypothetical protein
LDHSPEVHIGWCKLRFNNFTKAAAPADDKQHQREGQLQDWKNTDKPGDADSVDCNGMTMDQLLKWVASFCKNSHSPVWIAGRLRNPGPWSKVEAKWKQSGSSFVEDRLIEEGPGVHKIRFNMFTVTCSGGIYYPPGQAAKCLAAITEAKTLTHVDLLLRKYEIVKSVLFPSPFGVCDRLKAVEGSDGRPQVEYTGDKSLAGSSRDGGHGGVLGFVWNSEPKSKAHVNEMIPLLFPPLEQAVVMTRDAVQILRGYFGQEEIGEEKDKEDDDGNYHDNIVNDNVIEVEELPHNDAKKFAGYEQKKTGKRVWHPDGIVTTDRNTNPKTRRKKSFQTPVVDTRTIFEFEE